MLNKAQLKERIDDYLQKKDGHYAMLLYGEWGSGKSRFVRNELKPYLEDKDETVVIVYATAAGFSKSNEMMERLVTSCVNGYVGIEEYGDSDKKKKMLNAAKGFGLTLLQDKLAAGKEGLGITYSPTTETLLSLMLPKKCLIVIDDVERRACNSEKGHDDALFSVLCRLVEEQERKVLLIANDETSISEELKEKIVWDVVRFNPDPEELIGNILSDELKKFPDEMQLGRAILEAQISLGRCNARQFIKIKPLLRSLTDCGFFQNEEIDLVRKRDTLSDVLIIALNVVSGKEPSKPDESTDWLIKDSEEERYRKYKSLSFLNDMFKKGSSPENEIIRTTLEHYTNRYHPETQKKKEALNAIRRLNSYEFEDDEGKRCLAIILDALEDCEVDVSNIPACLHAIDFLLTVGLATQDDYDRGVALSREIVLSNTSWARSAIREDPFGWQEYQQDNGNKFLPDIDMLRETALEGYKADTYSCMMSGVDAHDEYALNQIAHNADAWFGGYPLGLTAIPPQELASYLNRANVSSLRSIHHAIVRMHDEGTARERGGWDTVREWDIEVVEHISRNTASSKMREFLLSKLRDYLESYVTAND